MARACVTHQTVALNGKILHELIHGANALRCRSLYTSPPPPAEGRALFATGQVVIPWSLTAPPALISMFPAEASIPPRSRSSNSLMYIEPAELWAWSDTSDVSRVRAASVSSPSRSTVWETWRSSASR
jgi:hypothetical protein